MTTNNKTYMKLYMRKYRRNLRLWLIEELGGKCVRCGEAWYPLLVFHHKNGCSHGGDHNFIVGGMQNLLHVQKLLIMGRKDELELLCTRCHNGL